MGENMQVAMIDDFGKLVFEGDYSYLEAGIEKSGLPGFHMLIRNFKTGDNMMIYFTSDKEDDWKKIANTLNEHFGKKDLRI